MLLDGLSLFLTAIGAVTSLWFIWDRIVAARRVSWRQAEKLVEHMIEEMIGDGFLPTLVFGISRGGAVLAGLICGKLGHRPLLAMTVEHAWEGGRRRDLPLNEIDLPRELLERVLLVSGEVHSGNSLRVVYEALQAAGATEIRRATLYFEKGSTEPIEYIGFSSSRKLIRLPWMGAKNYRRIARSEWESDRAKQT